MVLSSLFWIFAASMDACQDTLAHHYYGSVFYKLKNVRFWNVDMSNKAPYYLPWTKYKVDGWHMFKSIKIVLLAASVVSALFGKELNWLGLEANVIVIAVLMVIYGILWNGTFNLLYNNLLISRK